MVDGRDFVKQRADFITWRFPFFNNDAVEIAEAWAFDEADERTADGMTASPRVLVDDLAAVLGLIPDRIRDGHTDDAVWMAENARVTLARLALKVRA